MPRFIRFGMASGFSFCGNLAVTAILHEICKLSEEVSFAVSLLVVSFGYFLVCRNFVFETREQAFMPQLAAFYRSWALFRGLEYGVFILLHTVGGYFYIYAMICVQATFTVLKFTIWKRSVFRLTPVDHAGQA